MARGVHILSLVALLTLLPAASARALVSAGSSQETGRVVRTAMSPSTASAAEASGGFGDLHVILAARGGGLAAYGGGMRAGPGFGAGRYASPGFRAYPFRAYRFRPFIGFSFALPFYAPYLYAPYYYTPYYPYNPYCDPRSTYFYPPWCPY